MEGCIEKVTVLLDLGADVNYQDEVKISIVHVHVALIADTTGLTLQHGQSALHSASEK